MTTEIQRRRGTTAQHSTFTGAVGEVTVDTDKEVLVVHDGAQVGGYPQMRENGSNSALALGSAGTPSLKFAGDTNTGIYSPGADQVAISTNSTQRLLIDASGNVNIDSNTFYVDAINNRVAIGTTNPAQSLDVKGIIQTTGASGWVADGNTAWVYFGDSNNRVGGTRGGTIGFYSDYAPLELGAGAGVGSPSGSQLITFKTGTSERLRIDSSGRLLVGTSSTSANSTLVLQGQSAGSTEHARLWICKGSVTPAAGSALGEVVFGDSSQNPYASIGAFADAAGGAGDYPSRLVFSTTADGESSPTERMRITNGGLIDIGGLYSVGANAIRFDVQGSNFSRNTTSSATQIAFVNPNGTVGTITTSGSATAYNTSSDYRLKENVSAVTNGITRLQQLKPSRFNFIAEPDKTVDGFIAHEVQAVVPEAITGEKDAVDAHGKPVYQGIDQSKLVPLLTAALQEAVAKIESLETRLTAAGI